MNAIAIPDFHTTTKQDSEAAHERLKVNALVQLELLRDQMFFEAIDPSTSFKEKLAYAEHLVKSTPIESEMKKVEGQANAFQFAFQFQSPGGEVQTVGATIDVTPQVVANEEADSPLLVLDSPVGDFTDPDWNRFTSIEMEGEE